METTNTVQGIANENLSAAEWIDVALEVEVDRADTDAEANAIAALRDVIANVGLSRVLVLLVDAADGAVDANDMNPTTAQHLRSFAKHLLVARSNVR